MKDWTDVGHVQYQLHAVWFHKYSKTWGKQNNIMYHIYIHVFTSTLSIRVQVHIDIFPFLIFGHIF